MSTPSPASCSRKCPNGCRVHRAWWPCASCAPTFMPRAPAPLRSPWWTPEASPPLPLRSPWPPSLSGAGACSPERGHHECRRRARCRCCCIHSIPPPSEPSMASPSPPSAAPLDLLDRRHWPLLLPAVGTAAIVAAATVATPPQAASGQAGQPIVCA